MILRQAPTLYPTAETPCSPSPGQAPPMAVPLQPLSPVTHVPLVGPPLQPLIVRPAPTLHPSYPPWLSHPHTPFPRLSPPPFTPSWLAPPTTDPGDERTAGGEDVVGKFTAAVGGGVVVVTGAGDAAPVGSVRERPIASEAVPAETRRSVLCAHTERSRPSAEPQFSPALSRSKIRGVSHQLPEFSCHFLLQAPNFVDLPVSRSVLLSFFLEPRGKPRIWFR